MPGVSCWSKRSLTKWKLSQRRMTARHASVSEAWLHKVLTFICSALQQGPAFLQLHKPVNGHKIIIHPWDLSLLWLPGGACGGGREERSSFSITAKWRETWNKGDSLTVFLKKIWTSQSWNAPTLTELFSLSALLHFLPFSPLLSWDFRWGEGRQGTNSGAKWCNLDTKRWNQVNLHEADSLLRTTWRKAPVLAADYVTEVTRMFYPAIKAF